MAEPRDVSEARNRIHEALEDRTKVAFASDPIGIAQVEATLAVAHALLAIYNRVDLLCWILSGDKEE